MKIIEYRIFVPFRWNQCRIASAYSVNRRTKEFSGDGDGFEILSTEDYVEDGNPGHYVERLLHCKKKVPRSISWTIPEKYAHIHEHDKSIFPHYECKYIIPAMGDNFILQTETNHFEYEKGKEIPNNLNNWTEDELKGREVFYLDILDGPMSKDNKLDLHGFSCPEIGMKELISSSNKSNDNEIPSWVNNYDGPITLIVKTVKFNFQWYGAQTLVEKFVGSTWYQVYLDSHRSMVKWAPNWCNLSDDEISTLENDAKDQLKENKFDV